MKKWLCLILSMLMVLLTFSACGKSGGNDDSGDEDEGSSKSSSAEDVAQAHFKALYGNFEFDFNEAIDYELFDYSIMKKSFEDLAESEEMSSQEYFESISYGEFDSYSGMLTYYSESYAESMEESFYYEYDTSFDDGNVKLVINEVEVEDIEDDYFEYIKEDVDDYISNLESSYETEVDFTADDVTDAKEVTLYVSVEISGEAEDNDEICYTMVKVNGKWKVLESDSVTVFHSLYYYY